MKEDLVRRAPALNQKNRCIIVLGMHRSGTSSLMGLLQEAGVFLGEVHTHNPHNLKGNRENPHIMKLNQAVLQASGGEWNQPPANVIWPQELIQRREAVIAGYSGQNVWGFKDPRTLLTLDGWRESLPDAKFVGTFRHPASVAISLLKRSRMPAGQSLGLWMAYNERLLKEHQRRPFPVISFDLPMEEYLMKVEQAAASLNLAIPEAGFTFFENSLRHWQADSQQINLPPQVSLVYQRLLEIGE
jgi:hypothetical protein